MVLCAEFGTRIPDLQQAAMTGLYFCTHGRHLSPCLACFLACLHVNRVGGGWLLSESPHWLITGLMVADGAHGVFHDRPDMLDGLRGFDGREQHVPLLTDRHGLLVDGRVLVVYLVA